MPITSPYRSVLDYETEEELVRALEGVALSSSASDGDDDESKAAQEEQESSSDWKLSVYDAHTTLVQTVKQEAARLQAVRNLHILETQPNEATFDNLTAHIKDKFQVSWVFVSIVDLGRQWFKSSAISDADSALFCNNETSRQDAFCAHTILQKDTDSIFQVPDAAQDPRFCQNPAVTAGAKIRFYAGAPLVSPEDGHRVGALCIVDRNPRPTGLTAQEAEYLRQMGVLTVQLLLERRDRILQADPSASSSLPQQTASERRLARAKEAARKNNNKGGEQVRRVEVKSPPASPRRQCSSPPPTRLRERSGSESSAEQQLPIKKSRSLPLLALDQEASAAAAVIPSILTIPKPLANVTLPDPKKAAVNPDDFLRQLIQAMCGTKLKIRNALELKDYFIIIRDEQIDAYSVEIVAAARNNNVQQLQTFFAERGRAALDCYNRFGEGLLNLSCRRGFKKMVHFLLSEPVSLDVHVRDDYGRTPLHDACWNPEPQLEICELIMQQDPSLFLVSDKRGFTPFQYARKSDWHIWRDFLFRNRNQLQALVMRAETLDHFSE